MREIRACRPGELGEALLPVSHYFGRLTADEERTAQMSRILPVERVHVAREESRIVGAAGAYAFDLTVPGGRLPAAGIVAVGVLPTHRRRGILTELMQAQLEAVHEWGEPLACLWASEDLIYGRFGYGIGSFSGSMEIARERSGFHPFERSGSLRLVGYEEALDVLPAVYEHAAAAVPGMCSRSRDWWEVRVLSDPLERRRGGGEQARVVYERDGEAQGYALYRIHFSTDGGPTGFVSVLEAIAADPGVLRELWRYLLDLDWTASIRGRLLPLDHPLFFLLREPRRMGFRVGDGLWLRLVDVGAALSGRGYAGGGGVVLEVGDEFCPWNAGRWRLESGEATRTREDADLRCDVTALASAYLGGFTFAQLARAGRVEEARQGGIDRADALFRSDRAPWCPEVF